MLHVHVKFNVIMKSKLVTTPDPVLVMEMERWVVNGLPKTTASCSQETTTQSCLDPSHLNHVKPLNHAATLWAHAYHIPQLSDSNMISFFKCQSSQSGRGYDTLAGTRVDLILSWQATLCHGTGHVLPMLDARWSHQGYKDYCPHLAKEDWPVYLYTFD